MIMWKILSSHPVRDIPRCYAGETIDDAREWMQAIADSRDDNFGDLFFKVMNKSTGRELHSFFLDRKAKRRPFMKMQELHS